MSERFFEIQYEISTGEHSLPEIAELYGVSIEEVDRIWEMMMEQELVAENELNDYLDGIDDGNYYAEEF